MPLLCDATSKCHLHFTAPRGYQPARGRSLREVKWTFRNTFGDGNLLPGNQTQPRGPHPPHGSPPSSPSWISLRDRCCSLCRRGWIFSLMRAASEFFCLTFNQVRFGKSRRGPIAAFVRVGENAPRGAAAPRAINSFYKRLNAQAEPKRLDNCKSHLLTLL